MTFRIRQRMKLGTRKRSTMRSSKIGWPDTSTNLLRKYRNTKTSY